MIHFLRSQGRKDALCVVDDDNVVKMSEGRDEKMTLLSSGSVNFSLDDHFSRGNCAYTCSMRMCGEESVK